MIRRAVTVLRRVLVWLWSTSDYPVFNPTRAREMWEEQHRERPAKEGATNVRRY